MSNVYREEKREVEGVSISRKRRFLGNRCGVRIEKIPKGIYIFFSGRLVLGLDEEL